MKSSKEGLLINMTVHNVRVFGGKYRTAGGTFQATKQQLHSEIVTNKNVDCLSAFGVWCDGVQCLEDFPLFFFFLEKKETGRQTDRQSGRQAGRQAGRQTDTDRETDTQTDRQTQAQT